MADCVCVEGFYRFDSHSATCALCPTGAKCPNDGTEITTLEIINGFWRTSNATKDLHKCPNDALCAGNGAPGTACAPGLNASVAYCAQCDNFPNDYLDLSSGECHSCADSRELAGYLALGAVGLALLTCLAYCRGWHQTPRATVLSHRTRLASARASLTSKLKLGLSFYQVVAVLEPV